LAITQLQSAPADACFGRVMQYGLTMKPNHGEFIRPFWVVSAECPYRFQMTFMYDGFHC